MGQLISVPQIVATVRSIVKSSPYKVDVIVNILQIRKLNSREVMSLDQGHIKVLVRICSPICHQSPCYFQYIALLLKC